MKDFNQGKKTDLKDERSNIQKPGGAYNQNPQQTNQQPLPGKGGQTGGTTQGGVGGITNKDKLGNVDFNKNKEKDNKSSWK